MHDLGKKAYNVISRGDYDEGSRIYKDIQKISGEITADIDAVLKILVKTDYSAVMQQRTGGSKKPF